jgi:hypothetical protein
LGERGDEGLSCNTSWKSMWWLLEVEGGPLFCWVCEMREMKGGLFFLCSAQSRFWGWTEGEKGWVESHFWRPGKKKRKGLGGLV